jgi:hypothetical protein
MDGKIMDTHKTFTEAYQHMNESSVVKWEDLGTPVQATALQIARAFNFNIKSGVYDIFEGAGDNWILTMVHKQPDNKLKTDELKKLLKINGIRWVTKDNKTTSVGF